MAWTSKDKELPFKGSYGVLPVLQLNTSNCRHADYLDLTALLFNWGDSYDAKVSSSLLWVPEQLRALFLFSRLLSEN